MIYRDRATVCVSSQAGCAMGCGFCATGQAGFDRHLTTGEIVEQVVVAARRARAARTPAEQRRVHGHGRAAGERGVGVGGGRSGSTTTSGCRPGTSRCRPSASCRASARSPPAACRSRSPSASTPPTTRCATSSCRSTAATRSTPSSTACQRVPRRHRPPDQLRVGDDRRRQRSAQRRRRARRASPGDCARRPTST